MTRGVAGSGALNPHGTVARYRSGCHCQDCRDVMAKGMNLFRLHGPTEIDATGTRRRLQALAVMGWPFKEVARRAGVMLKPSRFWPEGSRVNKVTAARIARAFDELHMTPGPSTITRDRAMKKGWVSTLAWDNIDDPDEVPCLGADVPAVEADPVLIDRLMTNGTAHIREVDRPVVVAALAARGMTDATVAAKIGVWPETVLRIRQRHGIAPAVPRPGTRAA